MFYHRRLRRLVITDLMLDDFTPDENPPAGLILCVGERKVLADYALEGITNEMLVSD